MLGFMRKDKFSKEDLAEWANKFEARLTAFYLAHRFHVGRILLATFRLACC